MKSWISLVAFLLTAAGVAHAQMRSIAPTVCFSEYDWLAFSERSGEALKGRGIAHNNMYEMWLAPDGDFSITVRLPAAQDVYCVLGTGEAWHEPKEKPASGETG